MIFAVTALGSDGAWAGEYPVPATAVSTSMVLSVSGPSTINTFVNGFKNDVATALGVPASRVKVTGVQSGEAPNAKRISGGFADSGTGASAGTGENRLGVWSNFSGTGFNENQAAIATSGQVYTFAVGADYRINDWVLAGLSAGYERQSLNTKFNDGTWDANGGVVAPYVLVQLIPDQLFLDATAGYVGNAIDLTRNNGAITGDTSGQRFFMASNLTATLYSGGFEFRPSVGANWMYQGISGYQESGPGGQNVGNTTVHFGQFLAGGQVGYQFGNVQPYLLAQYVYAYKYDMPTVGPGVTQPIAYKNSANVGGGLLFMLSPRFSGGVQFQSQVGQTDYISYTGSGTIRYQF